MYRISHDLSKTACMDYGSIVRTLNSAIFQLLVQGINNVVVAFTTRPLS